MDIAVLGHLNYKQNCPLTQELEPASDLTFDNASILKKASQEIYN